MRTSVTRLEDFRSLLSIAPPSCPRKRAPIQWIPAFTGMTSSQQLLDVVRQSEHRAMDLAVVVLQVGDAALRDHLLDIFRGDQTRIQRIRSTGESPYRAV